MSNEKMFTKHQYRILLLSAMAVFFIIALLIYMFYIKIGKEKIAEQPLEINQVTERQNQAVAEEQTVMVQDIPRIRASTKVAFEIVDQFGLVTQKNDFEGIHWLGYTKPELGNIYPDYVITRYEEDAVTLTKVIERQLEPNYILTLYDGNIVISIERDGYKMFYKETGLEQHDLTQTLEGVLEKGIPITTEQKDAILENADEVYMILQEHDE